MGGRTSAAACTAVAVLLALAPAGARAMPGDSIMGGEKATTVHPWMASLHLDGSHGCGGTLVRPRWVLTAAHCLAGANPDDVVAVFGRLRQSDTSTGEEIPAEALVEHEGAAGGSGHDIGLVHLVREPQAAPIALAQPGQEALWAPGTPATVIGWGMDESGTSPDDMRQVTIPMAADADCAQQYGMNGWEPETEVCAGDRIATRSPCYGDSGGPLFVAGERGEPLQVGVVSRGLACGIVPTYSVYARVGGRKLSAWLNEKLPPLATPPQPAPPPPPAPPATGDPAARPAAPGPVTARSVIRFPRRRGCTGARRLSIALRVPAGTRPTAAAVLFGRRTARRWSGRVPARLAARRAPRSAFVARARIRLDDGTTLRASRRYGACRRG